MKKQSIQEQSIQEQSIQEQSIIDNWEDWESNESIAINQISQLNQIKILEERRLQEESDNKLTNALFSSQTANIDTNIFLSETNVKPINVKPMIIKKQTQKESELDKLNLSVKLKEKKLFIKRITETFGDYELDKWEHLGCNIEDKYI
jgi:hypothetical protein